MDTALADRRAARAPIPARIAAEQTPQLFAETRQGARRFWEFFGANVRNANTRMAYVTAAYRFADWCAARDLPLAAVEPLHVASYIEQLGRVYAPATVKQNLAALRQLFDWLVVGQVLPSNPAAAVRGPKQVVKTGKTPVLTAAEARGLLDSIDPATLIGLRDRALLGLMVYGFARISAALAMRVEDYYTQGKRSFFRLHEKGGKFLVIPAHHMAQAWTDEYIARAGLAADPKGPLFPSAGRGGAGGRLTSRPMVRADALAMIKRRAGRAGLPAKICAHSFRGTGITEYLRAGGTLETAARIAGHESTRTTQLYNRLADEVSLDEIERIHI
jgi:site-specific recombinase XerD